jgi:hypothetical protein
VFHDDGGVWSIVATAIVYRYTGMAEVTSLRRSKSFLSHDIRVLPSNFSYSGSNRATRFG